VDRAAFEHHLNSPQGRGRVPEGACVADLDGGACCDRIRFAVALDGERVGDAGFEADGCGAATAAGSAAVTLVRGQPVLDAARVGASEIASELGGLSPGKLHAAELAADVLARALGAAVRAGPAAAKIPAAGRMLVAMSGGVDSSVAALLCTRAGETVAVTLELWADAEHDGERSCCSASAVAQARAVAHSLGLPHFTLDLRPEFRRGVVDPFVAGYAAGETPNPCVRCNGNLRLDAMLEFGRRLGCDTLATGHYARVTERDDDRGPLLRVASDAAKDQTYMLAALSPASLQRMAFPLGELTKPRVRELAAQAGLAVASKADSQDLCFMAGTDRGRFLARHGGLEPRDGVIVDRRGAVLGRHRGQHLFTVGQRRGIGVDRGGPLYVLDKQATGNRVVVGTRRELETTQVAVRAARLHRPAARVDRIKLRYRAEPVLGRVAGSPPAGPHRELTVELAEPVDGAAPGQLACLLDGDVVVGWGTISR
jgi:tRNA-specific 2-thiouridylase